MLSNKTVLRYIAVVNLAVFMMLSPAIAADKPQMIAPPQGDIVLEVHGNITNPNVDSAALFDMSMLMALPSSMLETTTVVSDGVKHFQGFLMRDLLAHVGANGTVITATALNDYVIEFDAEEFNRFDILVAYRMDDQPLLASDKGPLWVVYPRDQYPELQDIRYDYRWIWQLKRLDIK